MARKHNITILKEREEEDRKGGNEKKRTIEARKEEHTKGVNEKKRKIEEEEVGKKEGCQ